MTEVFCKKNRQSSSKMSLVITPTSEHFLSSNLREEVTRVNLRCQPLLMMKMIKKGQIEVNYKSECIALNCSREFY